VYAPLLKRWRREAEAGGAAPVLPQIGVLYQRGEAVEDRGGQATVGPNRRQRLYTHALQMPMEGVRCVVCASATVGDDEFETCWDALHVKLVTGGMVELRMRGMVERYVEIPECAMSFEVRGQGSFEWRVETLLEEEGDAWTHT